ncbi:MAG: SpoIIE family protein phosphatase [Bacteroidetes bacterium]|nr:SpoIIE family protein phosphatase [Bacteroidota bacterium]
MRQKFLQFLLLSIILPLCVKSQHYNLLKFKSKDNLPGITISKIIKDSQNKIWIATQEGGIGSFNGKEFTNYTTTQGLISNDTRTLCEDNKGNIWIGTIRGLSVFDGKKMNQIKEFGLDTTEIKSIYADKKNHLYIATFGNGWITFDGVKFSQYTTKNGLPTDSILSTLEDKEGNFWVGTYHAGVCKISAPSIKNSQLKFNQYKSEFGGSGNIYRLKQDSKNNIWFGTTNSGVYYLSNDGTIHQLTLKAEYSNAFISEIVEDALGVLWFATDIGLIKYAHNQVKYYSEKQGLSSHDITALAIDHENNLWIGTSGQGICVFKNEAFLNFSDIDGLPNKEVTCFYQYKTNLTFIGTASGLAYINGEEVIKIENIPEINNQKIYCITADKQNNIWIGTENGNILITKTEKGFAYKKTIDFLDGIRLGYIYGLLTDQQGNVWIATSEKGVFKYSQEKIVHYTAPSQLLNNNIYSMYLDDSSHLWISYLTGGVSVFDGNAFTHLTSDSPLENKRIICINRNKNGVVFFGTSEDGLYYYFNNKFFHISSKDGLSSNVISSCTVDAYNQNEVWLGTMKGLNKLSLTESLNLKSIKVFTEKNGLFGNELSENTILIDSQKNIWVGGSDGFSIFNPTLERANLVPPHINLNGIRLYYQKVDWKNYSSVIDEKTGIPKNLNLSHKNNHLTFDFQAFSIDQGIQYSYILEGFDKEWSPLSATTEAIYSNIPSGKSYVFKVKAINGDGIWSKENIEFSFVIEAPFWQRWWFIALCIISLIVGIFFYINWRTAKLAKEKKLLEDTVAERTLELKDTNDQLSDAFKDIKDSINYAQKIQQSILPVQSKINAAFPDSFILFKPRDIVSGDFYWFGSVSKDGNTYHIIAAADCTGHGVPGAFMSMVGNTILNEIVITKHIIDPSEILSQLHHGIRTALQQSENESRDGMDICLCCINTVTREVRYAGAFNPLWILRSSSEIEIIKATKSAIGGFTPDDQLFESHTLQMQKGESLYLFTDGYADQFGGDQGKKLTAKKFREAILLNKEKTMHEQGFFLENYLDIWKGKEFQVDDILVIGVRV